MSVKPSVFGSRSEEQGFRSIEHTWGDSYRIFPQFPFSALFESDDEKRGTSNFFYKTSVDYLLATKEGQPILAIDFDGMGRGFNKSEEYIQVEKTPRDPQRKVKFDFKLKIANRNDFPYYIVSSEEFKHIDRAVRLTIVDGLIGSALAQEHFNKHIQLLVDEHSERIAELFDWKRQPYIDYLVCQQEVESNLECNPIVQKNHEIWSRFMEENNGKIFPGGWKHGPLYDPEHPNMRGYKYSFTGIHAGDISVTAWIRNFEYSYSIVSAISELMAWNKFFRVIPSR